MRRGRAVLAGAFIIVALALAAPAVASAAAPATSQGYPCATAPGGSGGGTSGSCNHTTQHHAAVLGVAKTPPPPINRTGVAGVLPFTGLQLGVVVGVAALLIAAGMVLRITGRQRRDG